jgi:hypothetical protein
MTPMKIPVATENLILRQMRNGVSFTVACADAGISFVAGANLMMADPIFRAKVYSLIQNGRG